MVSFDVKLLFTSVPVGDAISTISKTIRKDDAFESRSGISADTLIEMLRICLDSTSLQFRDEHYELTDGLAMGSPVSPAVANIFMTKLEEQALKTFERPPNTWHRFVDDVFSVILKNDVTALLQHLNNQHRAIQFTVEVEQNGRLPFLDTTVHHLESGELKTDTYWKPTHTGRYLDFASNHPTSAKQSVVHSLMKRIDNITFDDSMKKKEERLIKAELEANGYPASFIKTTTARMRKRRECTKLHE